MNKLLTGVLLALAAAAQAAGTAEVRFSKPEQFSDIGWPRSADNPHLRSLDEHLKKLAASLPDGQRVEVEFTDVDLAGEVHRLYRLAADVRVVRGTVDWARLQLRWRLLAGGRELAAGSDMLSDPLALHHGGRGQEAMGREHRLLERWWRERVLAVPRR